MKQKLNTIMGLLFCVSSSAWASGAHSDDHNLLHLMDASVFGGVSVQKLEWVKTRHATQDSMAYAVSGWIGTDDHRFVLQSEGEIEQGTHTKHQTEALWQRPLDANWNLQMGARNDKVINQTHQPWLAMGVEGRAPYWVESRVMLYLGTEGKTALKTEFNQDHLLTQKVILHPYLEIHAYGQTDLERTQKKGLSSVNGGLKLRYEVSRQCAPYLGIERSYTALDTQRYRTHYIAGLQFWF